jgi:hypothetical protein
MYRKYIFLVADSRRKKEVKNHRKKDIYISFKSIVVGGK